MEPEVAELADGRLLVVWRGSTHGWDGSVAKVPGRKFFSVSSDGGRTLTPPAVWKYDDGSDFYSPSSIHRMIRHGVSGKLYWLGNICSTPPQRQFTAVSAGDRGGRRSQGRTQESDGHRDRRSPARTVGQHPVLQLLVVGGPGDAPARVASDHLRPGSPSGRLGDRRQLQVLSRFCRPASPQTSRALQLRRRFVSFDQGRRQGTGRGYGRRREAADRRGRLRRQPGRDGAGLHQCPGHVLPDEGRHDARHIVDGRRASEMAGVGEAAIPEPAERSSRRASIPMRSCSPKPNGAGARRCSRFA